MLVTRPAAGLEVEGLTDATRREGEEDRSGVSGEKKKKKKGLRPISFHDPSLLFLSLSPLEQALALRITKVTFQCICVLH